MRTFLHARPVTKRQLDSRFTRWSALLRYGGLAAVRRVLWHGHIDRRRYSALHFAVSCLGFTEVSDHTIHEGAPTLFSGELHLRATASERALVRLYRSVFRQVRWLSGELNWRSASSEKLAGLSFAGACLIQVGQTSYFSSSYMF